MSLPVELLESSFAKVKPNATDFAHSFYENLFRLSPEAQPLFASTNMAEQKKKLLASLVLVVDNLRKPDALTEALEGLGAKHVAYGALPEHYPLVGNALLTTFEEYLKEDWTAEVKQAWVDAYGAIAELMLKGADYDKTEVALEQAEEKGGLQVELLESSFAKVKPNATDFAHSFYENLFRLSPEAQPLFASTNMAEQKKKLLASLVLVVDNLRKPDALTEALEGLGAKHVAYGALPEHYPLVGNALLTTFEEYLKEDWTAEVKQAWVDAYGAIAELMLKGADYSEEEVKLNPANPATPAVFSGPSPETQGEINFPVLVGAFSVGGMITALLLLLV